MPMGVWNAIGEMVATAADNNVTFRFQSVAPDNVMDFARKRRMRFTFDVEDEAIVVTLQHTLRHPSWLPEVVLPEQAEAVAASA